LINAEDKLQKKTREQLPSFSKEILGDKLKAKGLSARIGLYFLNLPAYVPATGGELIGPG